ncbi:hypothetical protein AK812_SmicGene40206 [Symbiodinium microadriaticum]|uniref:Uncharacterized protein n=1 Tax=Symbiodinium microadriaticum TaxID=2951 RepID=A0A1Q9C996_SYMMI|nr:hypothetical protein AK812_SmicGene40206 [Symbiodinium microadriaticum]CAE7324091.1 unnamed protein product [Symbiodinium microadriaticum]
MSSGVDAAGDVQPAPARGDDEPATSERVSDGSERHQSEGDDWEWSGHSHGASWWDSGNQWGSWSWNRPWHGGGQERRASWATSRDDYSTEASMRYGDSWNHSDDGHRHGGDRGAHGRDLRPDRADLEGVWQDPWADGRERGLGLRDPPGADRPWEATATGSANPVWSGWRHFAPTGSNYYGDVSEGTSQKNANPRPSEKLSVPVFNGGDEEDVGTSARSYLRQVEAWRRLTYLPPNQQGLVLYRHLAGKAWVAAEELNVDALSRDDGVHYLMSWLRNRYLDLEVTRIGKALSEMFRRLRRKHGQSIRDYNAEYDRLHARLKEVGCMLPEECAAWLYVDRLQLEEGAELNLLASVGNVYSLNKLQKAAIIQDRGLRKPWESGNGKGGRKPFTAHVTDSGDHDEDGDFAEEPYDGDEAMPEEVAVAYMTYQSAKNKYKEYAKARGYKGENHDSGGNGQKGNDAAPSAAKTRDEKLRQIKARSFCSGCGRKGHWHKDEECPNNAGNRDNAVGKGANSPREVCVTMPAVLGITDTACARTVAGTQWLQDYMDRIGDDGAQPELSKECEAYKFGTGRIHYSSFSVVLSFSLGDKVVQLRASIIPGDIPLLLSKTVLGKMGMIDDVSLGCADFTQVGLKGYKLMSTASGHPAIPIVPAKPAGGVKSVLSIEDLSLEPREQYTVHAVAYTGLSTQSLYNLYYEKKLRPDVKVMLSQTQLCRESFFAWWGQCEVVEHYFYGAKGDAHVYSRRSQARYHMSLVYAAAVGWKDCFEQKDPALRTWSPEEIKSVIMEFREARKDTDATEKMKKISQLTLDELKEKAKELNVEHPSRITKGNLLRLVRDSLNTPDNELMKIGKHRGLEFREIPWQYGQWASNEVVGPEQEKMKDRSYVKESLDETSRRPMPRTGNFDLVGNGVPHSLGDLLMAGATSADTVEDRLPGHYPDADRTGDGIYDQHQAQDPRHQGRGDGRRDRREHGGRDPEVGAPVGPLEGQGEDPWAGVVNEEWTGQKAGRDCCGNDFDPDQVITDGDLQRALRAQHSVLGVNPEPNVGDRRDLPPGERLAKAAYDKGDFTYKTLKAVLEAADLRPRRNDRGEAFADNNDHKKHSYFTFGLFTHGGVQGVTKLTVDRSHLCRYLNSFGASKIDSGQTWSSISIGKNIEAGVHRDYNNLKGTANHTCSFGQDGGGQVWLEDKRVSEEDAKKTDYVWRRGAGGAWLPGRLKNTFETVLTFDPHHNHATCPWEGEWWSMTFHTTRGILKANRECCNVLKRVGFPLPNLRGVQATPTSRRPKKSTRAAIGNVAGKLSAMMTTLLVAAGSYMSDYLPAVQQDPVVMFEIGGIDATYEAAEMNKAVIEPMTWDDYGNHERRKDAYHFVV